MKKTADTEAVTTEEKKVSVSAEKPFRAGFVALVGVPNAGKSTLANILVGEKFTIVSKKPQTTRRRTLGVVNRPNSQLVLMDAPGVINATKGLNQFLASEWEDVIQSADALLLVLNIDSKSADQAERLVEI
ncbi:MAG: 50S ribosome-binding GTPase, partial [Bdellovibrionales bacterium]|nr:50S ribosome-binding GTPase [Bdellovibrionales bacterium]